MFEQQFNNPYQQQPYGMGVPFGTTYTQYAQNPAPKMTQVLSQEQINKLRSNGGTFSLRISEEDLWKAVCTHKDKGAIVIHENPDGSVTCPICGETFQLITNPNPDDVDVAVNVILNFLQSIKTIYLNIPEETVTNFFQIIPLIKKIPQLCRLATDDFNRYFNGVATNGYNPNNGFNLLNNIMSPAANMAYGMPQAPMAPGMAPAAMPGSYAPAGFGMPQQMPMGSAPVAGNPFMMGGAMPVANPMMQPAIPQQQMAPAAPQAPAAPVVEAPAAPAKQVKQTKTMNV